jgi:hypothetical protein
MKRKFPIFFGFVGFISKVRPLLEAFGKIF